MTNADNMTYRYFSVYLTRDSLYFALIQIIRSLSGAVLLKDGQANQQAPDGGESGVVAASYHGKWSPGAVAVIGKN